MSVAMSIPLGWYNLNLHLADDRLISIARVAGKMLNLEVVDLRMGRGMGANSVDLGLGNAAKVPDGAGQSLMFRGAGVTVVFHQDAAGNTGVRVHGDGSEEELREKGEKLAKLIIQQYAYHRLVTEMKGRGMNIVEEEVEEDGTVRMRVRVYQG